MTRINLQIETLATLGFLLFWTPVVLGDQLRTKTEHEGVTLIITLSSDSVQVAEPLDLELSALVPQEISVQFPEFDAQLGEFDVLDSKELRDLPVPEGRLFQMRWTIESLQAGELVIPPIALNITTKDAPEFAANAKDREILSRQIETEPIRIQVRSMIEAQADPTKFRDIHSVIDVAEPTPASTRWLFWGGIGGTAVILAVACTALLFRRKPRRKHARWAHEQIEALRTTLAMPTPDHAEILAGADAVLREFLLLQFDEFSAAQTTQELVEGAKNLSLHHPQATNDVVSTLSDLFNTADEVKYAGQQLESGDIGKLLNDADQVIEMLGKWQSPTASQSWEER